ncbi:MAG TPA: RNA 2',3'-cyclic phosphodiesterase [Terriglobales bacterium]|nr:RNA 2',3'-cyclic phosphodiesterase [Terriglobales bacterium]
MRIFIALDIPQEIRSRIIRFCEGLRAFAPDANWVRPESFHLTLKFVGEKSEADVESLKSALHGLQARPTTVAFRGLGFFPNPKAPRVFWVGVHGDEHLPALALAVDQAASALGIPREEHAFHPHLTLARAGSGSPRPRPGERSNPRLKRLMDKLSSFPDPDFGTMTAREFYLYQSQLSPAGARYTRLERFALG